MKKICYTIAALVSSAALVSCQKEITDTSVQNGVVPFELNASISETKTTMDDSWDVEWVEGDVLYAVTTDEEWGAAFVSKDDTKIETIAEYTYSSGKFTTNKTISNGEHVFNFLYTRDDQKTYHRGTTTTLVLPSVQEIDLDSPRENLKLYDALAGQVTVETPSASPVEVSMSHVFSMMKVTLTNNTGRDVNVKYFDFKVPGKDMTGIFNISFTDSKCGISSTKSQYSDYVRVEATGNQIILNGTSKDVYYVLPPFSDFSGDVEMVVTTNDAVPLSFTKTISVKNLSFSAGKYTKGSFILVSPDAEEYTVVDTSIDDYSEGFESGFVPGTIYNNEVEKVDGPEGMKWASYFGTVSTNVKLDGSQSMHLRWYTNNATKLGYTRTLFELSSVRTVSFVGAATNGLNVALYYKTTGDWILADTFELKTTAETYKFVADDALENAKLMFRIALPNTMPSANSNLRIDNITVSSKAQLDPCDAPKITIDGSTATISCDTDGADIYYTIGDSPADPTSADQLYNGPVTMTDGQTIKAVAYKRGMSPSAVSSAKCQLGVITYTAKFGLNYNSAKVSSYAASWSATNEDFTVNLVNWNNNNSSWSYIKAGHKSTPYVATITNAVAIPEKVFQVSVTIDAITANNINSIKLYSGNSEDACTSEIATIDKSVGKKVVTIPSPAKGKFYKLSFDCKAASNGSVQVSEVVYSGRN